MDLYQVLAEFLRSPIKGRLVHLVAHADEIGSSMAFLKA